MEIFDEYTFYINPTDLKQLSYCPRFIYYSKYLNIPEQIQNRYKVQKGRTLHKNKTMYNIDYLRKKLNVISKKINAEVYYHKYQIKGIVDEILFLKDGTCAPLDYKYAKYNNIIYDTYKVQMVLYALMIESTYNVKVNKAYIIFTLSNNFSYELNITNTLKCKVVEDIQSYKNILNGYYPIGTKYKERCKDCFYKNICIK